MAQALALHPDPGWTATEHHSASDQHATTLSTPATESSIGVHCILELYGCDVDRLNDEALIRETLTNAAKRAGATLLKLVTHPFEPQGVTGLALLAESHISIHTWPETGYAAVDVFTCGDHTMPQRACCVLAEVLGASQRSLHTLQRRPPINVSRTERQPLPC
ncbi:MAG: adenosylmethionine decarboxylase [Aphanocapsa feldmannii 277cV]|uniref:S-adenosylmethionine decarboxylase proenzyme n=2 Tax=Aphanocapsa feldmannii TaxID=192050 RepID=A0A524RLJ8_9CHRO|nr:MAG: adenosylmethionine decarboxylase [Aphanocapsa feldmannii 288cV]TGG90941.1 MAG: adenosylmethionine decarboxylase [Aphanocapsa feldmannii 277cV]TGH27327.1 MAG: adenosylmethionine decarboxylase [Aphanocapsa feldmannii 277cI]